MVLGVIPDVCGGPGLVRCWKHPYPLFPGPVSSTHFWHKASLCAPPQEGKLAAWPRGLHMCVSTHACTIHPNFQMRRQGTQGLGLDLQGSNPSSGICFSVPHLENGRAGCQGYSKGFCELSENVQSSAWPTLGICCPTALPEGTSRHLEDPVCPRSHTALALQPPLFSGVCGMRLPVCTSSGRHAGCLA